MLDRYRGSLLGLALADAIGAHYEGGIGERLVWKALGLHQPSVLRWTDDTLMALGLAESLVREGGFDADSVASHWAEDATWKRGYGPGALAVLHLIRKGKPWQEASRAVVPEGSYGNGAAMRAAPLGLFYHRDPGKLVEVARTASSITHAHPLGIDGGVLIARATAQALTDTFDWDALARVCETEEFRARIATAAELDETEVEEVHERLGRSVVALDSAVTAVYLFARFRDQYFQTLMEFVIELGGDTDTIGAMAAGMWGAARGVGALPSTRLDQLEQRERIDAAATALHRASSP